MSLEIIPVRNRAQFHQFVSFPWQVYQDDPFWVPPLYHERLAFFNQKRNPFFTHADGEYYLAQREGQVVGTVAAIINHRYIEFQKEKAAFFGAFEILTDSDAGKTLLETAGNWARQRGAERIYGPATFSTNDECGLLIDGFESAPVMMMTYNPEYYVSVIESAGFVKAMDLWAWLFDAKELYPDLQIPERLNRLCRRVQERYHLSFRNIDMSQWPQEVERVKKIYNHAWEENWGFVPLTDAEIEHLANSLKPIIQPELALFVEVDGHPVGFALNLPDVNQPLLRIRPGPSLFSSYLSGLRLLRHKFETNLVRNFALGVIPEFRRRGVDALLYTETMRRAFELGYYLAEASWILENNDRMNRPIAALGGKVYKSYRIYEKELA